LEIADRISPNLSVKPIIIVARAKVTYGRREVLTDEFTVLLTGPVIDRAALERIARAILLTLSQPITFGAKVIRLSASIGMLLHGQAGSLSGETLLRAADAAMYRAKVAGKARIVVHELHDSPAGVPG
jgi:predicted signal transduction protein with EAL and GGDEF domain